ncbi:MAG TPA: ABC transporter permease [Candidatus Rubrimentiphilum sp.]|nr:ABC transporter permease [Candidatus Rubrimentiphilum sp.]
MSRFIAYIPEAFDSLWRNKTRSLLSILGMIIGIASVIAVLGLSQAASNGMKQEIAAGGDPGFVAYVDASQNNPTAATLYYRDAALLQSYASGSISRAIPSYSSQGGGLRGYRVTVSGRSDFINVSSTRELTADSGFVVDSGRLIDSSDVAEAANVCILSHDAAAKFFPNGNAVGNTINVGTQRLRVIGVVSLNANLFRSFLGETMYIPYTTLHHIAPGPIDFIEFWPVSRSLNPVGVINDARAALERIHPHGQYIIQDQLAFNSIFENVLSFIGIGLTFIGGVALFVAGVGIMNIMLVSVSERTREIGIRKSIGANAKEISLQFLIEATLLSVGGGIIGSAIGVVAVLSLRQIVAQAMGAAPVPWGLVIGIAAGFSLAVGIGFGSYPAARAGKLDPVEALRA